MPQTFYLNWFILSLTFFFIFTFFFMKIYYFK